MHVGLFKAKAQRAHASALRRLTEGGKGSVLLQVQSLAEMGAPVRKQLPADLVAGADATPDGESPQADAQAPG